MNLKQLFKIACAAALVYAGSTQAQMPVLEKSFDISRKAKNGYLGGIEVNNEKQTLDMFSYYALVTKAAMGKNKGARLYKGVYMF